MKILYFGLFLFILSCGNQSEVKTIPEDQNICKYSKWLRISEAKDVVQIEIRNPADAKQIVRLQIPNFNRPSNPSRDYDLSKPIDRLVCLSSTHIGMLSELNLENRIVGVSNLKYVYNEKVISSSPVELGEEQTLSAEKIISSRAQAVVYSGFSNVFPKQDVLHKLRIQTLPNYDWREAHPLGRAEWILLFGYLTGHAEEAKKKFKEICENYQKIKNQIQNDQMIQTLSGNMTGDYWYAPAGDSYHAQILEDAGLSYIFADQTGTGSLSYSFEHILGMTSNIDLWINPGFDSKNRILKAYPKSKLLKPLKESLVFCYTHNSNKYWELSSCRPDLILADYAALKKGVSLSPEHLFFYKQVK